MLFKDKEGNEIEIEDTQIQESVKKADWFNSELDRIREKGAGMTREQLTAEFADQKAALEAEYQKKVEEAKTMSTGKKDEQMQILLKANEEMKASLEGFKNQLVEKEQLALKSQLQSELAKTLAKVPDDFVRSSLIETAMKSSIIGEDGKASFKLSSGAMGSAEEKAAEFEQAFPQHFKSNQPPGMGVKPGETKPVSTGVLTEAQRAAKINAKFANTR